MNQSPITAIRRVAETEDQDRLQCATAMFNAFRECVEVLGGRKAWTADDFARLGAVLHIADELKPVAGDYGKSGQRPTVERKEAA